MLSREELSLVHDASRRASPADSRQEAVGPNWFHGFLREVLESPDSTIEEKIEATRIQAVASKNRKRR